MTTFTSYSKIPLDSINWHKSYKKIKQWAVTEKVHGSNFAFIFDVYTKQIQYAKRTGILKDDDPFFGYRDLIPKLQPKLLSVVDEFLLQYHDTLKIYPNSFVITIFGELFGEGVQSGIYYSPSLDFYAFDIYISGSNTKTGLNTSCYLDFNESIQLFEKANILYAKPLQIYDSYEKAIQHKIGFNSTIPALLGISYPSENKAEGIVVRSMTNRYITKIKIPEFSESKYDDNQYSAIPSHSLDFYKLKSKPHLTQNRLYNAISKVGRFEEHKEEIYELMVNDILEEVNGYHIYELYGWLLEQVKNIPLKTS